jgi:hypothetical protein
MSIVVTQAPWLARNVISPWEATMRSASRTGSLLVLSSSASSSWMIRAPGASPPVRIFSRSRSAIRWLATLEPSAITKPLPAHWSGEGLGVMVERLAVRIGH